MHNTHDWTWNALQTCRFTGEELATNARLNAPTASLCQECGFLNVLDNRADKCSHFCLTCQSTSKRFAMCQGHPNHLHGDKLAIMRRTDSSQSGKVKA